METAAIQTAIVTGGAKRIGAELVRALVADGWHVLIHYHRSEGEAEALAVETGASLVRADLADPDAADTIMRALDGLPPAHLLVLEDGREPLVGRAVRFQSRHHPKYEHRNTSRDAAV